MLKRLVVLSFLLPLVGGLAEAKDLRQRLGVGIKDNTSFDLPSLAAVYYPSNEIGFTGGLGMDTRKENSKMNIQVGVRRVLFYEEHMNFYFGGSIGMVNNEVAGDKQSGFELNALFGTEFFFSGLENLGWTFEGGAGVVSMKEVRFRTIADHPFRAGIVFYF